MRKFRVFLVIVLVLLGRTVYAEAAYVSERLYLGLYSTADTSGEPIKTMSSGTQVEIIQRLNNFVFLRLDDGTRGWARGEFITLDPPAKVQLKKLQADNQQLRSQLESGASSDAQVKKLEQQLAGANKTISDLRKEVAAEKEKARSTVATQQNNQQQATDTLKSQLTETEQAKEILQNKVNDLQQQLKNKAMRGNAPLQILFLLFIMAISTGLGAWLGMRWMANKVRQRFNGVKVW